MKWNFDVCLLIQQTELFSFFTSQMFLYVLHSPIKNHKSGNTSMFPVDSWTKFKYKNMGAIVHNSAV